MMVYEAIWGAADNSICMQGTAEDLEWKRDWECRGGIAYMDGSIHPSIHAAAAPVVAQNAFQCRFASIASLSVKLSK